MAKPTGSDAFEIPIRLDVGMNLPAP